jgi:DNA-binding beta-propeller fold protein YncE
MAAIRRALLTLARVNATHSQSSVGITKAEDTKAMPKLMRSVPNWGAAALGAVLAAFVSLPGPAVADAPQGFLETIHKHITRTTTVTDNGDLNPYAVVVAPVSAGKIQKDDVLVDNFNNLSNLQGTGTTIVDYNPTTKRAFTFAKLPQDLSQCPGGVGLTTAMTMLKSGWVIVGSTPSKDGTTGTKGPGCLIVFDSNGNLATVWTGPNINGPWGNMAVIDRGSTATLFVSMAGFEIPAWQVRDPATGYPVTKNAATVLRIELSIPGSGPPAITSQTVIASGISARADRDVFLIGPTGLALAPDGTTLYVSDAVANQIIAIPDAPTRRDSAGLGRIVTKDGLLKRPLALALTPEGHLLACNAKNGQLVEINPANGQQIYAQWIDTNPAQSPPGNGDLFGIAMTPDGKGFYYVEDDVNMLMEAVR